jgi:hypothetical protein
MRMIQDDDEVKDDTIRVVFKTLAILLLLALVIIFYILMKK